MPACCHKIGHLAAGIGAYGVAVEQGAPIDRIVARIPLLAPSEPEFGSLQNGEADSLFYSLTL
jgi:hypothetical protein